MCRFLKIAKSLHPTQQDPLPPSPAGLRQFPGQHSHCVVWANCSILLVAHSITLSLSANISPVITGLHESMNE